jgi:hypothetical protein
MSSILTILIINFLKIYKNFENKKTFKNMFINLKKILKHNQFISLKIFINLFSFV